MMMMMMTMMLIVPYEDKIEMLLLGLSRYCLWFALVKFECVQIFMRISYLQVGTWVSSFKSPGVYSNIF